MASHFRKKRRLLVALLVAASLCFSVSLVVAGVLTSEEESSVQRLQAPPGLRPVVISSQREILNLENGAARLRREDTELRVAREGVVDIGGVPPAQGQDVVEGADNIRVEPQRSKDQEKGLPVAVADNCTGPWSGFPNCQSKMEWMAGNWKKEACYAQHGVDGSKCSFQKYLSEVEHFCPLLPSRAAFFQSKKEDIATVQVELTPLVNQLSSNPKFSWLVRRISSHWDQWSTALHTLEAQAPFKHSKKNILVHIGALSDKSGFKFAENADHGGPLGELVQWSDLISSLYLLGHSLHFSTEIDQLKPFSKALPKKDTGGCPTHTETQYDVIYIDIVGLKHFKKTVRNRLQHFQCLFRVLDSFGTEPQFNFKSWKPPKRTKGDYGQAWGNWNFNPRQFLTMYPHSPDNSFLGFVVGNFNRNTSTIPKKITGLVYGKELYMWQGKRSYLDLISRYVDIHATIGTTQQKKKKVDSSVVPGYVTNHGILNSTALQSLLRDSKIFIGMGFPYEGPAPLEAIANGCVFLNPKLSPALNRYNSAFLKGKPTLRALTSQNPYTENFIGSPYVYTFNMEDTNSVVQTMEEIMKVDALAGYVPYEFTYEGMLERVMVYLENQDFCLAHHWPGKESLLSRVSKEGESCKDACFREGLVCEPELFSFLNEASAVKKEFGCSDVVTENSVHGPSSLGHTCSIQSTSLLYSCVGSESNTRRLCPCRTYRKGQVALCSTCNHH